MNLEKIKEENPSTNIPRFNVYRLLLLSLFTTTIFSGLCLSYPQDVYVYTFLFSGFIFSIVLSLSISTRPTWGKSISGVFLFGVGIVAAHFVVFPFDRLFGHDNIEVFVSTIASAGRAAVTLLILRYLWNVKYTASEIAIIITLGVLFTFPNAYYWIEIVGGRSADRIESSLGVVLWWFAASLGLIIADIRLHSDYFKKTKIALILKATNRNIAVVSSILSGAVLLTGSVLFYNPFETQCDKAQYVIKDMDTQFDSYQKATDELRAQFVVLGFGYQFGLAVNEVLLDKDIAKIESRYQELGEKASSLGEEKSAEQCAEFLSLKQEQATIQKEKFNLILKKLDDEAIAFIKR
ncbi:hypothetical protein A9Q99_06165 [Gammaproteobacteria bacterium 45_16_T64]|nr:hypothetical protein A9Q99_06165 [Gammaproteobacteria bacterium 45_16_T64]